MRIENEVKLDFCDVLIKPKRSDSPSRHNVDLVRQFKFLNSQAEWEGIPIIASNLAVTGTFAMAKQLGRMGLSTALHKFYSLDELKAHWDERLPFVPDYRDFFTIGIKDKDLEKLDAFATTNHVPAICIDVANGYTKYFVDRCRTVREKYPNAIIMAGNICTPEMAHELIVSGKVDIVKVGIGPGSVCTTRIVTGVGYPQLSAILEVADVVHGLNAHMCADGGCTSSGDIAKAFGAGADFVMLGGYLSGHEECDGEWEYEPEMIHTPAGPIISSNPDGTTKWVKKCLTTYGMSSKEAMEKHGDGQAAYKASEGKCVKVPYKGPVINTITEILGGLRSTCTYVGTEKLKDLSKCTTFVRVNRTHNTIFS